MNAALLTLANALVDSPLKAITWPTWERQAGSLDGLDATSFGRALQDYYAGDFRAIALWWERFERADDAVTIARRKRRQKALRAVAEWQVETADDSPAAKRQADFLRGFYNRLRAYRATQPAVRGGLDMAAGCLLDATAKGFSLAAREWSGQGMNLTLTLAQVPLWHFTTVRGAFHFHPESAAWGQPIDPAQWVLAAQPEGYMEAVGITCLFKRLPLHQLVHLLEQWGVPPVFGKTSAEPGSAAYLQLYNAVVAIRSQMAGVLGGDATIEALKNPVDSNALHLPWIARCDRMIVANILGGSLGTLAEAGTGTLAGGAQADDGADVIAGDLAWLSEVCQEQIDRPALQYALGVSEPLAWITFRPLDARNDDADMKLLTSAVALGARIPATYVTERFGLPEAEEGDVDILQPAAGAPAVAGAAPGGPAVAASEALAPENATPAGLNGAQLSSILEILNQVTARTIAPATAVELVIAAGMDAEAARRMVSAQQGAKPVPTDPAAMNAVGRQWLDLAARCTHLHPVAAIGNASRAPSRPAAVAAQRDLDHLAAAALPQVGKALAAIMQPLHQAVAAAADPAAAQAAIDAWTPAPQALRALADVTAQTNFAAVMRGYLSDQARLTAANALGNAATTSTLEPLPFDEAEDFWASKRLVQSYQEIGAPTFAECVAQGFHVAGLATQADLAAVAADIQRVIAGQQTWQDASRAIAGRTQLSDAHAQTIVRTNVQSAYSYGHWQQLQATKDDLPIWGFDVVMDDGTTPICAALHGWAYPAGHPIFNTLTPPNHYNCRTTLVAFVDAEDAAAAGFTVRDDVPTYPDTGEPVTPPAMFAGNVGQLARLQDSVPEPITDPTIAAAVRAAQALANP